MKTEWRVWDWIGELHELRKRMTCAWHGMVKAEYLVASRPVAYNCIRLKRVVGPRTKKHYELADIRNLMVAMDDRCFWMRERIMCKAVLLPVRLRNR